MTYSNAVIECEPDKLSEMLKAALDAIGDREIVSVTQSSTVSVFLKVPVVIVVIIVKN